MHALQHPAVVAWHLLLLAMVLSLLGGCAASTRTIVNDKASAEVKAKSFKDHKEVLFIPLKDDQRNVVLMAIASH